MKRINKIFTFFRKRIVLWALILGFVGTFVTLMDNFGLVTRIIDKMPPWSNISEGIKALDEMVYKGNRRQSILNEEQSGFKEILKIIQANRPELIKKPVLALGQDQPTGSISISSFGPTEGPDWRVIPDSRSIVIVLGQSPDENIFIERTLLDEWIKRFREQYYLFYGMSLISVGFILGIVDYLFPFKTLQEQKTTQ